LEDAQHYAIFTDYESDGLILQEHERKRDQAIHFSALATRGCGEALGGAKLSPSYVGFNQKYYNFARNFAELQKGSDAILR